MTIIQIYGFHAPEDAAMVAALGVEHIGLVAGMSGYSKNELSYDEARAIFAAAPAHTVKVAICMSTELDKLEEMLREVKPDILQLARDPEAMPPERVRELKERVPGLKVMQGIPVGGPETREKALHYAKAFEPVSDYLILDTVKVETSASFGATGKVHDWTISRDIVQMVNIPVVLAGGLSAENVVEAIRMVHPWGVDSLTSTSYPEDRMRKDPERCRAFVEAVRSVT